MPKEKDSGFKDQTNEERKERKRLIELEGKDYKEFDDEVIKGYYGGSSEYVGDGEGQKEFFKNNSDDYDLIDEIANNDKDRAAFLGGYFEGKWQDGWTGGEFMLGQQWGGFSSMDNLHQNLTRVFDKYLDKAVLKKGVVVSRLTTAELLLGEGHKTATLDQLKALYGQSVVSRANMSCGVSSKGLHIGDTSKSIELKIHIPTGAKGAGMWIGDSKIHNYGIKQREYITNRDSIYMVGKTTTRIDHNGKTVYVVNLYYDGRMKHQYN